MGPATAFRSIPTSGARSAASNRLACRYRKNEMTLPTIRVPSRSPNSANQRHSSLPMYFVSVKASVQLAPVI